MIGIVLCIHAFIWHRAADFNLMCIINAFRSLNYGTRCCWVLIQIDSKVVCNAHTHHKHQCRFSHFWTYKYKSKWFNNFSTFFQIFTETIQNGMPINSALEYSMWLHIWMIQVANRSTDYPANRLCAFEIRLLQ